MKKVVAKKHLLCIIVVTIISVFMYVGEAKADTYGYYNYTVDKNAKTATINSYTGDELIVSIPKTLGGYKVTKLGYKSFFGKTYMQKVNIPTTVISIDDYAFAENKALKTLVIPNSVKEIGFQMGRDCSVLSNVTIGSGVKEIPTGAFANCYALTTVKLSEGLTKISGQTGYYGAFQGCSALKNITIPSTVTEIGEMVFTGCTSLTEITIPNKVKSLGYYVFGKCTSLETISVGTNVEVIPRCFAMGCTSLKKVIFKGNKINEIIYDSFSNCKALEEIEIPKSVNAIGKYTFSGCGALKKVTLNEGLKKISSGTFMNCTALEEITIPSSVVELDGGIFNGCKNLKTVILKANINVSNSNPFSSIECAKEGVLVKAYSNNEFVRQIDTGYNTKFFRVENMTTVPSTKIAFSKKSIKLGMGSVAKMPVTITPSNSTDSVYYTTSNSKIVSVNQRGEVTGTGLGAATITARTNSGLLAQFSVNVLPAKVKGFKDTARGVASIKLQWNEQADISGYYIYQKVNGKWKNIKHVYKDYYNTTNSYTVTGLKSGTTYQFAINAYKEVNGQKYLSISFPTLTTLTKPAKVTQFKKSVASKTAIKTTWKKVSGATGYVVYRYQNKKWVKVATTKNNYYTYTKLKRNTSYKLCIKAYKTVGTKTEYGATTTLTTKTSK